MARRVPPKTFVSNTSQANTWSAVQTFTGGTGGAVFPSGVWTPTLLDASLSACENQTYTTQVGTYLKIGRLVHVQFRIVMSSLGCLSACNAVSIGGLPFTSENTDNNFSSLAIGAGRAIKFPRR